MFGMALLIMMCLVLQAEDLQERAKRKTEILLGIIKVIISVQIFASNGLPIH